MQFQKVDHRKLNVLVRSAKNVVFKKPNDVRDHLLRKGFVEPSEQNTINKGTHFLGSQSNQHQPLTTELVHMQRLSQPPTLKDYLLLILSIYLAKATNR